MSRKSRRRPAPEELEAGLYVGFRQRGRRLPDNLWPATTLPTPGTDYYFDSVRSLGEHALRYMDENPIAAMRLSDPDPDPHSHRQL